LLLLHRAWASADAAAREDRPQDGGFRRYLSALSGQRASAAVLPAPGAAERARWAFSACFLHPARSPRNLEAVLGELLSCAARVHCFVPDWLELPPELGWRLGSRGVSQLGVSTVVGRRVYQPSQKFRVELGPLSHATFQRLLPGSSAFAELTSVIGSYAGPELRWELLLRLEPSERPALRLGKSGRLGRDAWLPADAPSAQPRRTSRGRNSAQHVLIQSETQRA
jgi:type VI secretion system protein ImpH